MPQKRLRIFAGPNGSGKSSLLRIIPSSVPLGIYINADEIEKSLAAGKGIELKDFGIKADTATLHSFFKNSGFVKNKSDASKLMSTFSIVDSSVKSLPTTIPPKYSAAIIAEFLREENLEA